MSPVPGDSQTALTRILANAPTQLNTAQRTRQADVWPIGAVVDGRYTVEDVRGGPGVSGMGVVYILSEGERRVAAKTFQHRFSSDLDLILRFLREAKTWMLTGFHPNIVQAQSIDIIDGTPYLFMEYIDGGEKGLSLADWTARGPVAVETTMRFALQCCDALVHATAAVPGLVHRDLKPENLLIERGESLKITDFGLVRCNLPDTPLSRTAMRQDGRTGSELTTVGSIMGTPAYMAPEQFFDPETVDMKADIYAFGCCFYEALCGQRVFQVHQTTPRGHMDQMRHFHLEASPVPLRTRGADIPKSLDAVLMRCLRKEKEERWPDFHALRDALAGAAAEILDEIPEPVSERMPQPEDVAAQVQSLSLIDGYDQAVRHQALRDSVGHGPYAFHLALASYFHVQNETGEEERQLFKARRASPLGTGHEAARRLADLYNREGDHAKAEAVIDGVLSESPDAFDDFAEPYCEALFVRGAYDEAERVIQRLGESLRGRLLRAKLLDHAGRYEELAAELRRTIDSGLNHVAVLLGRIRRGTQVGWDQDGDEAILPAVLAALDSPLDTKILEDVEHAPWPRLDGYPDFALVMAFLSDFCGRLSELEGVLDADARQPYGAAARLLGYPQRLVRFLQRDENWIWMQQTAP